MTSTPNLALPQIAAAQAQKHVTHNEALRILDAVVQLSVLDRDLALPPGNPSDGDRYIVAPGGGGGWAGHDGEVAVLADGAWTFLSPRPGWLAFALDDASLLHWTGDGWQVLLSAVRPSFQAHKTTSQGGVVPSVATKVTFGVAEWNIGGHYDPATSRFTPPPGRYAIAAGLHLTSGVEDNARAGCLIYKNGLLNKANYVSLAGTGNASTEIDALVEANGTDYFEIYVLITGSANKTILANNSYSWFCGYQI